MDLCPAEGGRNGLNHSLDEGTQNYPTHTEILGWVVGSLHLMSNICQGHAQSVLWESYDFLLILCCNMSLAGAAGVEGVYVIKYH